MEDINKLSLKDKLGIRDFICKFSGLEVLDLRESYYLTSYSMQNGISQQIKSQLASQGITPEVMSAIFDIDENLLTNLLTENSNVLNEFDDEDLSEEYKKSKAKIDEIQRVLDNDNGISPTERKTLETTIIEAKKDLHTIKGNEIQLKLQKNPQALISNPKAMKTIINLISNTQEIKPISMDENKILLSMQNKIIDLFVLGKKEEHEKLKIDQPLDYGFSKKDFLELLNEIGKEEDNMCSAESVNFFMNMKS
jgi:hypothetical protein